MNPKQFFISIIVVVILSLFTTQTTFGQINITLPKIPWGKNKKEEPKRTSSLQPTPTPSTSTQNTSLPVSTSSSSIQKSIEKKSIGTIFLSNKPFPPDGSVEGSKTKFNSNEFVYGRLLLNGGTVREILKPVPLAKPYDDILIIYFAPYHRSPSTIVDWALVRPEDLDKTYWDFELLPNPESLTMIVIDNKSGRLRSGFTEFLYVYLEKYNNIEGEQKFGVEIAPFNLDFRGESISVNREKVIKTEFIYNFKGTDYQFVKANSQKVSAASRKADGLLRKVPDQWTEKSNPLAFGVTEAILRSMFLNYAGSNTQILKLYAYPTRSTTKWTVSTNALGIPTVRYHNQIYMIFYKDAKDGSCYAQDLRLLQRYTGGGKFSATILEPDNRTQIICSKLGIK